MKKNTTQNQLLLLEDVRNLGRKGELVKAKPGFVRNFLLPEKKAVIADNQTIRMQERLKEERAKQAIVDKKDAEELANRLETRSLSITTKVDSQGHLYGSITTVDIAKLLKDEENLEIERKEITLLKPIKTVGVYEISLRLKEGVLASFKLQVKGEGYVEKAKPLLEVTTEGEKPSAEAATQETFEEMPTRKKQRVALHDEVDERTKG